MYYVGVYGYEMSDYVIGVAMERKGTDGNQTDGNRTDTEVTEIRITKGLTQSYTMDKGRSVMKFTFTTPTAE